MQLPCVPMYQPRQQKIAFAARVAKILYGE
jgi:hypothetical protein